MGAKKSRRKRSQIWKLPSKEFKELVAKSKSIKDALLFFGLSGEGNSYLTFTKRAKEEGIDLSLLPSIALGIRGIKRKEPTPLKSVMVRNSTFDSYQLKKRLIKENVLENKCSVCGIGPEWNNKPLNLRLDHINGINNDARGENLRLVCPNCDSQLDTYCGRNRTKNRRLIKNCTDCGKVVSKHSGIRCRKCNSSLPKETKIDWPSDLELLELVRKTNKLQVSKALGVSDAAVRKRLKMIGLRLVGMASASGAETSLVRTQEADPDFRVMV